MNKKMLKRLKKLAASSVASAILVFLILLFMNVQDPYIGSARAAAESFEYLFYDEFFKIKTGKVNEVDKASKKVTLSTNYDSDILIVDIDENSLGKLGNYNTWDRSTHAKVVEHLNAGGAAAIGFDILFKEADFGEQKAKQTLNILKRIKPDVTWDSLYEPIKTYYNYDSMLVHAVEESGNTIVSFMVDDTTSYRHESLWQPLSTERRAKELGYNSTLNIEQVNNIDNVESKALMDNIFPALAKAGIHMGSVNAYPDDDGVLRHVSMLYRFPDPDLEGNEDVKGKIYSTVSLMAVLHLFHQSPENIKVKMGEYMDIGKPFGVYRDSAGTFHTTFPHFGYPMFDALQETLHANVKKIMSAEEFEDIASKIIAMKSSDGVVTFEIFEGQVLNESLSNALREFDDTQFEKLNSEEEIQISENISLKKDSEGDNRYVLTDSEEEEEAIITPYIVKTLKFFADSLDRLENGKSTHLSMDLDILYEPVSKMWKSNLIILSDDVIRDIINTPAEKIAALKPGEEIRFGRTKRIPIDMSGRYQVNYQGRYNTLEEKREFQRLSYYDVYANRVDPGVYQGKIFILGSTARALFDFVPGPHEENFPAVLIHSTIIKNILTDKFMVTLKEHYQQFIVLLLAIIFTLIGLAFKSYISIAITVLAMAAYSLIAYKYFLDGIYIGMAKQLLAIPLTNIAALVVQFYYESKEKMFLGNAFKQYISPELIDEMVNNEIMPTLGGEKSNITAYFTDIASFSTFSEKIGDPSKLVELLNEYLTAMTDTLLGNKGTLDKYEGDAIIAFFGAPMPLKNHAQNACETAVDMQNKLMGLRKKWASEGTKWPKVVHDMHMRIGINSGDIVTGNMGSTMRKNYTMMGDAVNLAARLESAAKQYGAYIQISEDTQSHLEPGKFLYRSLDTVRVVGKSLPVKTFELLEKTGCKNEDTLKQLIELWEQGREAYLNMEWDKAIEIFTQCLEFEPHLPERDPGSKSCPSLVYIKRCEDYKLNPPVPAGEKWDGVFTATSK